MSDQKPTATAKTDRELLDASKNVLARSIHSRDLKANQALAFIAELAEEVLASRELIDERDAVISDLLLDSQACRMGYAQAVRDAEEIIERSAAVWLSSPKVKRTQVGEVFEHMRQAVADLTRQNGSDSARAIPPALARAQLDRLKAAVVEARAAIWDAECQRAFGSEGVKVRVDRILGNALAEIAQ